MQIEKAVLAGFRFREILITESNGSGSVTGTHVYSLPGVYTITVTVRDDDGGTSTGVFEFLVVYDPASGFVTGGGWITSPQGLIHLILHDGQGHLRLCFKVRERGNGPHG